MPADDVYPVAIYTLGCKLNQLESEAIADSFNKNGFSLIDKEAAFDRPGIVIINTCTVTSKADQKSRRLIRKALRDYPESCVIVTGCYAQLDTENMQLLGEQWGRRLVILKGHTASTAKSSLLNLPAYVQEAAQKSESDLFGLIKSWAAFEDDVSPFSFMPQDFIFHSRGYLKIQDGCNNQCNYCRARLARGPGVSISAQEALERLRFFEDAGCAELMLTGLNISQYRQPGLNLAGLLNYLLEGSTSIALRLSSLEPEGIDKELALALAHPRIRPHFHLSVQSGSNAVLEKMGRAYGVQTVEKSITLLRSVKDNPFIACDIIAGFPGESEDDFAQTIGLCENADFAWIHAFPYSKRPGTPAFSMGSPVCEREAGRRVEALGKLALSGRRRYAQAWIGRELSAVTEKGRAGRCRAVSENYLKLLVNCDGKEPPPGSTIRCIPVSLCEGANGENPDAVADQIV